MEWDEYGLPVWFSVWFRQDIVAAGRLPLFAFLVGLLAAFVGIRVSVRLIRAGARWWPGNVRLGGLHVHHAVFGLVAMVAAGIAGLAVPDGMPGWRAAPALLFGVGTGLVLDEFALILHLEDVYWTERGRTSVDAVFAAVALSGMVLIGLRPLGLHGSARGGPGLVSGVTVSLVLAVVTLVKGKIWTGLVGIFCPPLLVAGALRLSRPQAPWARWRYGARHPYKQHRAQLRELRLRVPVIAAKVRVQEALAGRHDLPDPRAGEAPGLRQGAVADLRLGAATAPGPGAAVDPRLGAATAPGPGAAVDPRLGAATAPGPGAATDPRLGAATDPKPGTATDPKPGAATDPRPGAAPAGSGHVRSAAFGFTSRTGFSPSSRFAPTSDRASPPVT
ncbi:hypothetical protein ACH4SP_25600 [Streptomyces sp. NPDC021093]|uniref:hypothetical protein n=1 Tax=Streptomyces sp. NPDC021093 TaxID=3365112 RepID=UPI0037B21AA4